MHTEAKNYYFVGQIPEKKRLRYSLSIFTFTTRLINTSLESTISYYTYPDNQTLVRPKTTLFNKSMP